MFRFPSVSIIFAETYRTFLRFPSVILSALLGATVSIAIIEVDTNLKGNEYFLKLLLCSLLGIPLFFSISLFTERKGYNKVYTLFFHIAGIAILVIYYFSLSRASNTLNITRFFQLNLCLHLMVAFVPFLSRGEVNGFWQYNKTLFLRFLTSILFSGVLFAGLALALAAVDALFDVHIPEEVYIQEWVIIAFLFNTAFFLGGIPDDLGKLNNVTDYPKGLKIFTRYILIPLTIIYFVILYAYTIKIAIVWEWPRGWIAPLVSGLSILGILSLLFLYPIQHQTENKWIKTYSKWFYIALFPLILLLFAAIWRRVSEYGITEKRYFLLALTLWLTGIAFYFTFSKEKSIKVVPITLFLFALITSFGPWGAYSISEMSQAKRLQILLAENGILRDGKVTKAKGNVSFDDRKEISSIIHYLLEVHGTDSIAPWFEDRLRSVEKTEDKRGMYQEEKVRKIVKQMGLKYVGRWEIGSNDAYFNYTSNYNEKLYKIAGYDYIFTTNLYSTGKVPLLLNNTRYEIVYLKEAKSINVKTDNKNLINLPIDSMVAEIRKFSGSGNNYSVPVELMKAEGENEHIKVKIYFQNISGKETGEELDISYITADILIGFK
jgi:hypothetical protein